MGLGGKNRGGEMPDPAWADEQMQADATLQAREMFDGDGDGDAHMLTRQGKARQRYAGLQVSAVHAHARKKTFFTMQ